MTRSNENIMRAVAYNRCSPEAILAVLSLHDCADVRIGVVCNTNTPAYVLQSLESDTESEVLLVLSKHDNTPEPTRTVVLEKLSRHDDSVMRRCVALNPRTPAHVLKHLSSDSNFLVRYWVAQNPNTSAEILDKLRWDSNFHIRVAVKNRHRMQP